MFIPLNTDSSCRKVVGLNLEASKDCCPSKLPLKYSLFISVSMISSEMRHQKHKDCNKTALQLLIDLGSKYETSHCTGQLNREYIVDWAKEG